MAHDRAVLRQSGRNKPKRLRPGLQSRYPAIAGAAIAVVLTASAFLRPQRAQSVHLPPEKPVKIAAEEDMTLLPTPLRAIAKGEKLDGVAFAQVKWPKSRLSGNYVRSVQELEGATALAALPPHLPLPRSALSKSPVDASGLVERIPEGMRAVTVKVDDESSVEGWARSGSYVDVIVLRNSADKGVEAKVIAENIRILSAGRSLEPQHGEPSPVRTPQTVTLLVSQEDALKVKTAANVGKLTFALRGAGDEEPAAPMAMNQRELLGGARTVLPPKPRVLGTAVAPDGKTYILGEDARWVRASESLQLRSGLPDSLAAGSPAKSKSRAE